jgi:hypothetical protein
MIIHKVFTDEFEGKLTYYVLREGDLPILFMVQELRETKSADDPDGRKREVALKLKAVNYSTTEVAGKYYMLTIAHIGEAIIPLDPEDDKAIAKLFSKVLLEAAEFWHDHALACAQ